MSQAEPGFLDLRRDAIWGDSVAGCYDLLTHLFAFHPSEAQRMAPRLKIPWGEVARKLAEKPVDPNEGALERVPEPEVE